MFLQAGKHVCVEYPMTLNYNAAVELWDLAQEKGTVKLMSNHSVFFVLQFWRDFCVNTKQKILKMSHV